MTAEECRERAKACFRMMEEAPPSSRETFRHLAESWLVLADEAHLYGPRGTVRTLTPPAKDIH
jgi:hypothetical protein